MNKLNTLSKTKTAGKIYIYNLKQAYFYIQQGLIPLDIQRHYRTNKIYFVFDKAKSNPLYTRWLNNEGELIRI